MKGVGTVKKKLFVLTLLVTVFIAGFAYAEGEAIDMAEEYVEEILVTDNQGVVEDQVVEETEEVVEVEEVEKVQEVETVEEEALEEIQEDVEEVLEEVEETLEEQEAIADDEKINDEELEEAIDEVINLEEADLEEGTELNRIEEIYYKGQQRVKKVVNIVEKQYNMKKQFVQNAKEAYMLTTQVEAGLKDVGQEIKDIIKDKERTIDKETYGNIRETTTNLKEEVRENDYMVGTIIKETRNYIVLVKNRQFRDAAQTFENILLLQEQQLDLLHIIDRNVAELQTILVNA